MPQDAVLPDDLLVCQGMIRQLLEMLQQTRHELDGAQHRLDQLLKRLYGPKGERFNPDQLTLFNDDPEPNAPEPPPPPPSQEPASRPRKKGHGRKGLPKHLRRERKEFDLSDAEKCCPCCQQPRIKIGEEASEQLDYVPASLFVREQVRFKYACPSCLKKQGMAQPDATPHGPAEPKGEPVGPMMESFLPSTQGVSSMDRPQLIVTAPMPKQPIAKGIAGPGLLAHLIVSKYLDHLPLHRLEGIFARQGVDISRKTMCDWMAECAALLKPLYDLLKADVVRSRLIHTDDTRVPVQDPESNRTKSGRLWVYIGDRDHPSLVYDYTPTRARDGPAEFLKGYRGFLQADAYGVYDSIYSPTLLEAGCWAHARRYFYEARESDALRAHEALARIQGLYAVESEADEQIAAAGLTDEAADLLRRQVRQEKTLPLLDALKGWLQEQQAAVLPKSLMGQAIGYTLRQWQALARFTECGWIGIDNNVAERALRGIAVGRKNWLFAGSDEGGRTAAVLYSILMTCKHLSIEPFNYLRDILARLPEHPVERLQELLPAIWASAQRQQA